ncbi:DNA glycosylase [Rhabdobacter roseus]|uniref:DNA-3-methyladenine glycosylase II n=1 Tax=Rhabdobacter roseus TaxID=1655419 RepID=A0A840TML9_9BACT|nr:DNA-3-methyladenine glycosylase [Rhabdobacter roseus]MBB5285506.1 DNA-3-methyladenine glycosylase II [Rhabdobacter roseus]
MTTLQLPTPPLFSFQECLWFLDRNYDDIMHRVAPEVLLKPFRVAGEAVLVEVTEQTGYLQLRVLQGTLTDEAELLRQVTELFDLTTDLAPFYKYLRADPELAFMAEQYHGLRLVGIPDLFEALCWSIIGQQINLTFAYRLKRRLVEAYGEPIRYQDETFYLFPTPAQLAALTPEALRALQFSTRKAEYLIGVARAFTEGTLSKEILQALPTTEAMLGALVAHKGIGQWTANYALMKSLKVPTCIPYGDVGLYNALRAVKGLPRRPSRPELDAVFEPFRGWEGYLTFYLWRTLASPVLKYP